MLAVIEFSAEGLVVIAALMGALAAALVAVFKLYDASRQAQIEDMRQQREGYRKGYERTVALLEAAAQKQVRARGGTPIPKLAPVLPEHGSPVSEAQQAAADLGTLKAREAVAALILGGDSR